MDLNQNLFSNKFVALLKDKNFREIVDNFDAEEDINFREYKNELEKEILSKRKIYKKFNENNRIFEKIKMIKIETKG